ncbi:MAG: lysine 2,3-aminomutase [Candidatus Methanomethylophilaceae archaeon]
MKLTDEWNDWRWQLRHSIRDLDALQDCLGVDLGESLPRMEETLQYFPMSITPYYASLMDRGNLKNDPVFMQAVPSPLELEISDEDMDDPLSEDLDSSVKCVTHRYPDRVLFTVSNTCSMYCRHCTRKRKVGDADSIPHWDDIQEGIEYIRQHPKVRDVLVSGGDPLMLDDSMLDKILKSLTDIEHVEVIRMGTRMPVVLPQRVDEKLVRMLSKHQPIWINTHFNHPQEITPESKKALAMMADAGIPLGNQTVLLAGVNDCPLVMRDLVQTLVRNRVRPYYLYQCDLSRGISHFRTPVTKGIEIMENLIGHTSGFAVPTYVVDAPGGGGKIPVMPNYVLSWSPSKVILRNYEGVITTYRQPSGYKTESCDGDCEACRLKNDRPQQEDVGVAGLLSQGNEDISLVPEGCQRYERRENE